MILRLLSCNEDRNDKRTKNSRHQFDFVMRDEAFFFLAI